LLNIVALHRKLQKSKVYFITPYSYATFSIPIILSFKRNKTTFKQLYELVLQQTLYFLEGKKQDKYSDVDDKVQDYPFVLKRVTPDGSMCSICPWYKFCFGCEISASDDIIGDSIDYLETISIDWIPDRNELHYHRMDTKGWYEEDKTVKENQETLNKPITLTQCMKWFSQAEDIGDEVYCSQCKNHMRTKKKNGLMEDTSDANYSSKKISIL